MPAGVRHSGRSLVFDCPRPSAFEVTEGEQSNVTMSDTVLMEDLPGPGQDVHQAQPHSGGKRQLVRDLSIVVPCSRSWQSSQRLCSSPALHSGDRSLGHHGWSNRRNNRS